MITIHSEFASILSDSFIYLWMALSAFVGIIGIFKVIEKTIKFTKNKIYIKIKLLNDILLALLVFSFYLLFIDFYIFLSIELSNFTNTNIYGSPLLILIINICSLPLDEIIINGFKTNLNFFINKDVCSYSKWFRNYLICIIVLYLDLFLRGLTYTIIPKLIILINYLMSFNIGINLDISSLVLIFEFSLLILLYSYGKYLNKSNFFL